MKIEIGDISNIIQYCNIKGSVTALSPVNTSMPSNPVVDIKINNQLYTLNKTILLGLSDKHNAPRFLLYICGDKILIGRESRFNISSIFYENENILYIDSKFKNTVTPLFEIITIFKKLRHQFKDIYEKYINNTDNTIYASFLTTKQTGHHLHNELPGLYSISNLTLKYIFSYTEIFAKHEDLFPDKTFVRYLTNEEIFQKICNENITILKCTVSTIQPFLLSKIKNLKCKKTKITKTNKCILFTIRLSKRILTNQVEFITKTILCLEKIFPNSTYYIDGCIQWYNTTPNKQYWKDSKEQQLFNNLKQLLPNIKLQSLIGMPVFRYLKYLDNVDFYIAHCHTPQHKIGYLTNACGLFHGAYNDKPISPRPKEKEIEEHRKTDNIFGVGCKVTHYPHNCFTYNSLSSQHPAPLEYTANITNCIEFIEKYLQ